MKQILLLCAVGVMTILAGVVAGKVIADGSGDHGEHDSGHHKAHWSYGGDSGPAHWSELDPAWEIAETGTEQSPIDIDPTTAGQTVAAIDFHYGPNEAEVVNNGHTIQVNVSGDGDRFANIGGVRYDVLQFHFHAPSEHTVLGDPRPMEMHLVHQNAAGALGVVGVFMVEGAAHVELDQVFLSMPAEAGKSRKLDAPVNLSNLLPSDRAFFRYDGSLTTPPCSEGVLWSVMAEPIQISTGQLSKFHALYNGNARPIQPVNTRTLKAGR